MTDIVSIYYKHTRSNVPHAACVQTCTFRNDFMSIGQTACAASRKIYK